LPAGARGRWQEAGIWDLKRKRKNKAENGAERKHGTKRGEGKIKGRIADVR
jgi:hypothetical protein